MPRYYFDLVDGRVITDQEGQVFADLSSACESANISAFEIMSNAIWEGRLPSDECIRIRNDEGQLLKEVRFCDLVSVGREQQAAE